MEETRSRRLRKLVRELRRSQGHSVGTLASALGVSRRTVFRDLALLRELGLSLEFDTQRRRFRLRATNWEALL